MLPLRATNKRLANLRSLCQLIVMGRQTPILPASKTGSQTEDSQPSRSTASLGSVRLVKIKLHGKQVGVSIVGHIHSKFVIKISKILITPPYQKSSLLDGGK